MRVSYAYMLPFILSSYRLVSEGFREKELIFSFEEYVKSQLHLQVAPELFDRSLFKYANTMLFLRGEEQYLEDCGDVLRYFYEDISNMIVNMLKADGVPALSIKVEVGVDHVAIPKKQVKVMDVVRELELALNDANSSEETPFSEGVFTKFKMTELGKLTADDNLALAAILLYYGKDKSATYALEVQYED